MKNVTLTYTVNGVSCDACDVMSHIILLYILGEAHTCYVRVRICDEQCHTYLFSRLR